MKVVKFLGGLGNQLFQYAFYCILRQKFRKVKADLSGFEDYGRHNGYELERIFGIRLPLITPFELKLFDQQDRRWVWRKLRRIYGTKNAYHEEPVFFAYDASIFKDKRNRYYWGYWQHINYVEMVADQLRTDFRFPAFTDQRNTDMAEILATENTVSVHVRRGDYLDDPVLGGICDEDYYHRAVRYVRQQVADPRFVFFSNDITWCKETFHEEDAVFVDWNKGMESFRDMQLMSLCNHHIIANSSFSWWAAWLNNRSDKIIVSPKHWVTMEGLDVSGIILPEFYTC